MGPLRNIVQFRDRKSRGSILRHSTRSFTSGLFRQFDLYLNYGGQSQGSDTPFRDLWLDLLALRGDISVMAPKDVERRPLRWSVGSWMRNDIVQYNLSFAFIRVYKPLYGDHVWCKIEPNLWVNDPLHADYRSHFCSTREQNTENKAYLRDYLPLIGDTDPTPCQKNYLDISMYVCDSKKYTCSYHNDSPSYTIWFGQ